MKKIITHLGLFAFLSLFSSIAFAQNFDNAQDYQNYILAEQAKIINKNISYISKSLHDHKVRQNEAERKDIIAQLEASIAKVEVLEEFEGDGNLKNTALEVFKLYKKTYELEFKKAEYQEISKKTHYEQMKAHFDLQHQAEEKLITAGKKFLKAQKAFARAHELEKKEDEQLCFFSKVAEVNTYSRAIFLDYAKMVDMKEAFFDAMKKKQSESMEANRSAIIETATEVLASLEKQGDFEGQSEYVEKARELTSFLKKKAEEDFVEIIKINQNSNATFQDANRFNRLVIGYYKQIKSLSREFQVASVDLMHKSVSHEANQAMAHIAHQEMAQTVAKLDLNSVDRNDRYEQKDTRERESAPLLEEPSPAPEK